MNDDNVDNENEKLVNNSRTNGLVSKLSIYSLELLYLVFNY